ncbi:MAG: hypothetical protein IJZ55_13505 [Lachnospiraceae bacterium]|nr:hypothetical protein [Lachnospiraceae bacterium]
MEKFFIELLNMGLTATWVVLAVLAVRGLCHKAPRSLVVALWGLVGLRLVCPFVMESVLSLIPSAEIVSPDILLAEQPKIHTGVTMLNSTVNPLLSEYFAPGYSVLGTPTPGASANPMQIIAFVAAVIWIVGMGLMFTYSLTSYLWLRHKVKVSLCYRDNIYICDSIATPFVFGVIKPRIYVPSGMEEEQMNCVIAHESAHLNRKDHWWKTLAFFLLSVYWFQPLLWISYLLFSKDIERACDERVVREMEPEDRKWYAEALVSCSLQKRRMFACPLAFGEVGVKNRVKSVLNYKKPAFWIVAVTIVAGLAVAVCFLTNPKPDPDELTELQGISVIGGADGPTATLVGEERYELPEYRKGSNEKGLYVFIWQLGAGAYSCGVMEKRETGYTTEELWSMKSLRMEDARSAVESYGYPREAVTIVPFSMPYSSYMVPVEDPVKYREELEALFWEE